MSRPSYGRFLNSLFPVESHVVRPAATPEDLGGDYKVGALDVEFLEHTTPDSQKDGQFCTSGNLVRPAGGASSHLELGLAASVAFRGVKPATARVRHKHYCPEAKCQHCTYMLIPLSRAVLMLSCKARAFRAASKFLLLRAADPQGRQNGGARAP